MRTVRLLSIASTLLACACGGSTDPTELVVVVATDFAVPDQLANVHAVVLDAAGQPAFEHDFLLQSAGDVPFSFAIMPHAGDASREITVALQAQDAAGGVLFTRRAHTGFRQDTFLRLPMFLSSSCPALVSACESFQTCGMSGCIALDVPPSSLQETSAGDELSGSYD